VDYAPLEAAIRGRARGRVLDLVSAGPLADIAAGRSSVRAVRHPLGFTCLPIHRAEHAGACIHMWPKKRQPSRATTSPYHCHSWDLLSYVLYGSVGNQLVDVSDGTTFKAFEVRGVDGVDHLFATGERLDVRGRAPQFWSTGKFYELAAGEFHASVMQEGTEAATVVLASHNPSRADVTLASLDTPDHQVIRPRFTADETARIATRTLHRLDRMRAEEAGLVGVGA
jgi:hypothetical protein